MKLTSISSTLELTWTVIRQQAWAWVPGDTAALGVRPAVCIMGKTNVSYGYASSLAATGRH